jgi:uncharacterized membrane protein
VVAIPELTKYASGHKFIHTGFYLINCLNISYHIQMFIQMTDFKQQVGVVNKHYRLHSIKCVLWSVFVFVFVFLFLFHRTKNGNIVLDQGLSEIFGLRKERVAGG